MRRTYRERFEIERNGLTIRGTRYGEPVRHKPAVILSHGFMANSSMCGKYAGLLAELGCSQGGFVSAMAAADAPERIASLVLLYPAFCIPDDARKGRMMFAKFDPANVPEKLRCGPMRLGAGYVKAVQDIDPCAAIRGYTGPVLYLHGTADKIVDIAYARRAKQEYPDCEYHEIDGGGHMFRGKYDRIAQDYIKAFFESKDAHEMPAIR